MYNWIMQLDRQYQANLRTSPDLQKAQQENQLFLAEVRCRLPEYLCWMIYQSFLP